MITRAERELWQDWAIGPWLRICNALTAADALREWMRQHPCDCDPNRPPHTCTCGYDAALAAYDAVCVRIESAPWRCHEMTPQCPHCGTWTEKHEWRRQWILGHPFTMVVCPKMVGWRLVHNEQPIVEGYDIS